MLNSSTSRHRRVGSGAVVGALVASGLLLTGAPAQAADIDVTRADIANDADPYAGWHLGTGTADQVGITSKGLTMIGKTQVIKGFDDNDNQGLDQSGVNADLSEDLVGAKLGVTGGKVHFQVPIFFDHDGDAETAPKFATLRNNTPATGVTTVEAQDSWTSSGAIGDIPAQAVRPLSEIIAAVEAHEYKTIAFGVFTDTSQISSVASIDFGGDSYSFVGDTSATSTAVDNGDIRDEETSSNYDEWHQGYDDATARHQVTADGLQLVGRSQIIKGYGNNNSTLNAQNANLAFELLDASFTVAAGSDDVHFQVPVFYNDGSGVKFTTLRSGARGEGTNTFDLNDQWQSSKALTGIAANTDASLGTIIAALGQYKTIAFGVLTNTGDTATVSNITFDGRSFDFADAPNLDTTVKNVLERDIAPDEDTYAGWHQGASTNTARIADGKLKLGADKSQIINGYENNSDELDAKNADLREVLRSAAYDVGSGTVHFQIPMFVEDPMTGQTVFTTLRTTAPAAVGSNTFSLGQEWTSSKAIGGVVDANGSALMGDILSALPNYKVIAFGVYADAGADGVVNSISWDGVKYTFVDADPTAEDISTSVRSNNGAVTIPLKGADAEGDVTYTVGNADHGTVDLDGDVATYTPDEDFSGEDTFTYTVSDGGFNTVERTVTVSVNANAAPVVTPGLNAKITEGDDSAKVVLSATDAENDEITGFQLVGQAQPSEGFAFLFPGTNELVFVPAEGLAATEDKSVVLQVTATDSRGAVSAPADVTITVEANDAPTAPDLTASTAFETAVDITLTSTDANGDAISYDGASTAGQVDVNGDVLTFTPQSGFSGPATVTYTASDGRGGSTTGTISVSVGAKPNGVPTAGQIFAQTDAGKSVTVTLQGSDPDGEALTYSASVSSAKGAVRVSGNRLTFTPRNGVAGTVSISYRVTDSRGAAANGTVVVTVNRVKATVRAKIANSKFTSKTKLKVDVTVKAGNAEVDGAKVTIKHGSKTLGTGKIKNGKVRISIGKLKKGTSTLKVSVASTATSTAATTTLKVKVKK